MYCRCRALVNLGVVVDGTMCLPQPPVMNNVSVLRAVGLDSVAFGEAKEEY